MHAGYAIQMRSSNALKHEQSKHTSSLAASSRHMNCMCRALRQTLESMHDCRDFSSKPPDVGRKATAASFIS